MPTPQWRENHCKAELAFDISLAASLMSNETLTAIIRNVNGRFRNKTMKVHPVADILPMMTKDELNDLAGGVAMLYPEPQANTGRARAKK